MFELFKKINKAVDDFFEQQKHHIYPAAILILLIDALIAIPFTYDFLHTHLIRNFMTFGSALRPGSFFQFVSFGVQWLAFVDIFILLPAVVWSMLMPSVVAYIRKMQSEEE